MMKSRMILLLVMMCSYFFCCCSATIQDDNTTTIDNTTAIDTDNDHYHYDRNLQATLQQKWNLTANGFAYDTLSFTLDYITSDFILNNMMNAIIYDEQCQEGNVLIPSTELNYTVVPDATPPGVGDATRNAAVAIDMNPATISNSVTYSEQTISGQVVAQVRFCMRFGLLTNTATPIEVNFLETIVTLTVDLTDGFSIDTITVAPKDVAIKTASQSYQVEGYQCDAFTNEPLSEAELAASRNQGTIIRVCVRPDQTARDDGIFMRSIDSFAWERDYDGVIGIVTQPAVENREPASNQLTDLYCTSGDAVCAFETILFAALFRTPGAITGSGIASLQFGSDPIVSSRRNLRQSSRAIQEDDEGIAATAEFQLDMEVIPVRNPYYTSYTSSATSVSSLDIIWIHTFAMYTIFCAIVDN